MPPPKLMKLDLDDVDTDLTISMTWSIDAGGTMYHKPTGLSISKNKGVKYEGHEYSLAPEHIELEKDATLGHGAGGVVQRGVHTPTGMPVAIKTVKVDNKGKRDQMLNEIKGLIYAKGCPYLVQWYAAFVAKSSGAVHVALELMDRGSLADLIKVLPKDSVMPENILGCMSRQILMGLKHLHDGHMLHRDIKPANILVNSQGRVKLTDFGISRDLNSTFAMAATFVGTAIYMSPERALGQDYGLASDLWSVGMVVYELAAGRNPFPNTSSFPVLFDFLCSQPEPRLESEANREGRAFSPELCDFVACCLTRDSAKRWDTIRLLEHPFIRKHEGVKDEELASWLEKILIHHRKK